MRALFSKTGNVISPAGSHSRAIGVLVVLCLLPAGSVSADFFDKLRGATKKAGEVVRDVRDTVDGSREIAREAEDLRQRITYVDDYTPTRRETSQLQGALNALGFSTGKPDGLIGGKTRDAIRLYQSATGVAIDGTISYELIEGAVRASRQTGPVSASLSRAEWQEYQRLLNELGYDVGTPDGLPGKRTRSAITRFLNDRGLPVVGGIDRYGFTTARRTSAGGGAAPGVSLLPGGAASGPISLLPSGDSATAAFATGGSSYVIGSGDQATDDAARAALSLMLIRAHPELLESPKRVNAWFVHEGRTVESEYLREAALNAFREELGQRPAPASVNLTILDDVYLRKGEYDPDTGLFNARFDASSFSVRLPQLGGTVAIDLPLTSQLPVVKADELYSFDPSLGIPMSLEEAIAFERDVMVDSRGRQSDSLATIMVSEVRVDGVELEPLARDRVDAGEEFRKAEARSTLTGLSLHRRNPRGAAQRAGELVHRWTLDPMSAPTQAPGAFDGVADVSLDLAAIAARFGMKVFEGHLDTGSGDLGSFAAAMAIGDRPELLDRSPDALIIAQALLNREERAELFGSVRHYSELTEVSATAVHERIKGELREFLLARAVPSNLPLLLVHGATLGRYDIDAGSFPLDTRGRSLQEGRLRITSAGQAPLLIADTGDRWLPERVTVAGERAATIRENVFGSQGDRKTAAVRHGRFGTAASMKVGPWRSAGGGEQTLAVVLDMDITREALLSERFDDVVAELPAIAPEQAAFSELVAVTAVPIAENGALIASVIDESGVSTFRESYVRSANRVRSANEFDRAESIEQASAYVQQQADSQDGPLWLAGTATLGEYRFDTQSFAVQSLSLAAAAANPSSNQMQFRAKVANRSYGSLEVSMAPDLAERVVRSVSSRTFDVRARVTPLGAVANVNAERPGSSTLEITHRIDELAVLLTSRDTGRQQWELLSRDRFDAAQDAPTETVIEQEPLPVDLGPMPMLDPDVLLLMAARSADTLEASTWDWLFANRYAYDTGVRSTLGQHFFEADAPTPDRGVARIERPGFQAWVDALQIPELDEVRVTISTGYQMERGTAERCFVAASEESWQGNGETTFASSLGAAERRELRSATVSNLRTGEFVVRSPAVAGFSNLSSPECLNGGRSFIAALGLEGVVAPKITLLFDTLPVLSLNASNSAIVEATLEAIEFDAGESDLPDVTVRLAFAKASFYANADNAEADPVRTLLAADLVEPEKVGKDVRMADADVVDVKIGMPLSEAAAVLDAHFPNASVTEIRRGFTTDPGRFEQGSLWIAENGGEYVAVFHEGDPEEATVLGVTRGLRLDGVDFNRDAALQALRSKYGPEDHVEAERSLAMLWGKHVIDWPQELGRTQTGYRSGKGACEIDWQPNGFPNSLRDADGSPLNVREKLATGRSRSDGFHLRWPAFQRAAQQDLTACDYYVAAFHDDGGGSARIFVGLFDIAAYEAAFAAVEGGGESAAVEGADTAKPSVKF